MPEFLKKSDLFQCLEQDKLNIPKPETINGFSTPLPYVIVGDEAFPLKPYLMRPYPGRGRVLLPYKEQIYNYRLSRARRIIENCFGILTARWRIFRTPIVANIDACEKIIKAGFVLHNYLRTEEAGSNEKQQYFSPSMVDSLDENGMVIPGTWRDEPQGSGLTDMKRISSNMSAKHVTEIRNSFACYFVSPAGAVAWQHKSVT